MRPFPCCSQLPVIKFWCLSHARQSQQLLYFQLWGDRQLLQTLWRSQHENQRYCLDDPAGNNVCARIRHFPHFFLSLLTPWGEPTTNKEGWAKTLINNMGWGGCKRNVPLARGSKSFFSEKEGMRKVPGPGTCASPGCHPVVEMLPLLNPYQPCSH